LRLFREERVRLATVLEAAGALLIVFTLTGRDIRDKLFVRVLDVAPLLRGEVRVRSCGTLSSFVVPGGGFVEYDAQNESVWAHDGETLHCWDARSFERRFVLGPWIDEDLPNLRFTDGLVGLLSCEGDGRLWARLHSVADGASRHHCRLDLPGPADGEIAFIELVNEHALLKRVGGNLTVVDLAAASSRSVEGTEDWDPDLFVFLPTQDVVLARFGDALEIWRCGGLGLCHRLSCVEGVGDFRQDRFSIDQHHALVLVVRQAGGGWRQDAALQHKAGACDGCVVVDLHPPEVAPSPRCAGRSGLLERSDEELALLDIEAEGAARVALRGACGGVGGGGLSHVAHQLATGTLLCLGQRGGVFLYGSLGSG